MKKKIISLLSAFVMILGTVLPATQSVYAAGSDIVAEPYISATGEATCGTDGVSTTYKGVWKASIPMAIAMESVANKIPSTGYPHGKDGKNKIAYVEYRVTFPKGAKIIEDDKDEIKTSSNSAMFNGKGIEFLRPETNIVTFKIPLMDVDLPSLKANYEKDKKDNPETKTVDLSIPYTLTANTLEEAKEFEAGKITSTGEIEIHPSGSLWKFYKVIYSTDKATVSLATGLSECFAPVPAEKVTVTFELGDGVEFADANFVNTPVEIEKGQMLTEVQLPKVKAKEGYTLVEGWSIQPTGAKFDIANPISDSMTLRATATKNAPQEQEFKVEIPLEGDILIGDETEHDKVFESTKDASHEFVGTLNVKPIKDKLAEIEGQYQSAAQNPDGIAVSELDFSMVATFTLPEEMEFNPAEVKATLTEANDKFEITETKTEGKKVTVTMKLKGTDFDTFAKVKAAVTGAGDLLKVTLSGAKFTDSAKVNTNYTVHGIVGGNFTAKAEYNNNPIKFNIVFVGEQSATGKDAILANEPDNKGIQFTLKYVVPQEQEFKVEIPLEGDILIGDETEHDKVFESTKDASHEFVGTLNVKPIKDKLAEIEGQYQSAAQNPDGIAVSELDFSMVATFTLPEEMEFNPAEVKATLTEANDKFEITETKTEGKKVTVTMKLKGTDFDTFAKVKAAVTGAGDLLKVTLSGAKFTDSAKVNTNYTVHGIVGGNFTAKAEYNNNPIKFNIVFVGEQSATGKDAILASEPNNTNIQFTLKYYEKEDSHSSGHGGSTSDKTIKKEVALNKEDHYQYLIGYKDQTFRPNDNMTREEVTVMFSRLLANRPIKGMVYSYNLSDISTDRWSVTAISYLNELKIIEGYVDGTFKPKKSITRAEFAAIASRFANLQTGDKSFSDVMTSHWAYDSIRKAAAAGWISGYADGTFKPDQPITRAEVVSIVNRMLNRYADAEFVEKNKNEILYFSDIHNSHWAYYPIVEATNGHDYTRKANGIDELWSEVNGKSFVYDK